MIRRNCRTVGGTLALWGFAVLARAQTPPPAEPADAAFAAAVEQLRHAAGDWTAITEFLNPDGSVARRATGTYRFEWVVPDRVLQGRSDIPELEISSGLLFYVKEKESLIEMASVGRDGHLWVMSGPAGSEVRTTPPTPQVDGSVVQLRFTRERVTRDRFESKMEHSTDGGKTWLAGNRQVFERKPPRPWVAPS